MNLWKNQLTVLGNYMILIVFVLFSVGCTTLMIWLHNSESCFASRNMQANPPQLHSNLLYIQRYRGQSRLVGEAAYHFTNMLSAESFISNINARSISMEETEFEKNMESARALLSGLSTDVDTLSNQSDQSAGNSFQTEHRNFKPRVLNSQEARDESSMSKVSSLSDIENKGATMLLKEDIESGVLREYPYLFARVGDLTINDVEELLNNYKQLVFKYVCLSKGLGVPTMPLNKSNSQTQLHSDIETSREHRDTGAVRPTDEPQEPNATTDISSTGSAANEENVESKYLQGVAMALQAELNKESSE